MKKLLSLFAQAKVRELLEDHKPFDAIRRVELALGISPEVARDVVDAIRLNKPHELLDGT